MRFLYVFMLLAIAGSQTGFTIAQEAEAQGRSDLRKLLTTFLQSRLAEAEAMLRSLKESRSASLRQLLDAEDQIDKWRLQLNLATQANLISNHPVFSELRRELGVPEVPPSASATQRQAVSELIQEYLRKRLLRAERAHEAAVALHKAGRAVESDVLTAKSKVQGLKLLFEVSRLRSPGPRD